LFGLFHLKWLTPGGLDGWLITFDIFATGLALAAVALRTGSLWASFLTHAAINLFALVLVFFSPVSA
jgi:membrane protease YdiL (CAAX protease family)